MKHSNKAMEYVNNPEYIDSLLGDFSEVRCELDHTKTKLRESEQECADLKKQNYCGSDEDACSLFNETGVVCYRHLYITYERLTKDIAKE